MKNKLISIIAIIFVLTILFSGCADVDEKTKFLGLWEITIEYWPHQISFSEDISKFYYKNESYNSVNFSYEIFENTIIYLYTNPIEYIQQINLTLNYTFSENNNILTLLNPRVSNYNDGNYIGIYHKKD